MISHDFNVLAVLYSLDNPVILFLVTVIRRLPMRPYSYRKDNPEATFVRQFMMRERGKKVASASFLMIGLSLFSYVGGYYYLWSAKESQIAQKPGLIQVLDTAPSSAFVADISQVRRDGLSDPSQANASTDSTVIYPTFALTVDKLRIEKAKVTTDVLSDNEDIYKPVLLNSLAHYKGTAYPGESGNSVIYGHSIMPVFYNPKNFLSIFSTLDTLAYGDQMSVTWGDKSFVYEVEGMEVVEPSDTRALRYSNGKTMTLITCVPPGYTSRRLLVFTRLVEE
jgi:LPXTG-site transpeptidase (sortase) family protein